MLLKVTSPSLLLLHPNQTTMEDPKKLQHIYMLHSLARVDSGYPESLEKKVMMQQALHRQVENEYYTPKY
jgi:hypothetical protein